MHNLVVSEIGRLQKICLHFFVLFRKPIRKLAVFFLELFSACMDTDAIVIDSFETFGPLCRLEFINATVNKLGLNN